MSERRAESEVAHKWARWLRNPCRLGGPHRFRAGGQNHKWPTSGQGGYITPAAWGVPSVSERRAESEVAHKWARWLHNPCRLGVPTASKGAESEVVHKWARWLHNPSPPLQGGGQNQKWPTSGQGGYITPAAWGVPSVSERRAESEVAQKWARWLHNPCRLGVPTASKRGAESEVVHKWARWLHNPCRLGVPTASKRGAESEVAHKWARWLHNSCRLGRPQRVRAAGRIRSGPKVGKVAT